jgi:hypothetical protein
MFGVRTEVVVRKERVSTGLVWKVIVDIDRVYLSTMYFIDEDNARSVARNLSSIYRSEEPERERRLAKVRARGRRS